MEQTAPSLNVIINFWSLLNQKNPDGSDWTAEQRLEAVRRAGFEAVSCPDNTPGLKASLGEKGLRFGGAFDATEADHFKPRIGAIMAIDDGPINCQLADHDTPLEKAIELTIAMMEEAERQGARVHLEVHRDTCTETPEKAYAIAEGVKDIKGRYPLVNFDFSHPAVVKHLNAGNYAERLFENIPLFQQCTLWHMRPFNGHHCQIPVSDGKGSFSPEYEEMRPFIAQAFKHWMAGPRPDNELWVMPELGPFPGYGLSCFPNIWEDTILLGHDIRNIWNELL